MRLVLVTRTEPNGRNASIPSAIGGVGAELIGLETGIQSGGAQPAQGALDELMLLGQLPWGEPLGSLPVHAGV